MVQNCRIGGADLDWVGRFSDREERLCRVIRPTSQSVVCSTLRRKSGERVAEDVGLDTAGYSSPVLSSAASVPTQAGGSGGGGEPGGSLAAWTMQSEEYPCLQRWVVLAAG